MKKSVILLLVISLVAGCGKSKQLVSPLDPPAGTQSESEAKSEEEKKEEKKTDYMWYVRAAGYTAIAAGTMYLIYYVLDMCNKEPIPPQQGNQFAQNAGQQQNQQQAVDTPPDTNDDESIPEEMLKTTYAPITPSFCPPKVDDEVYNDYSDTPVAEAIQNGDGVQFDIFNHAQAHGYPNNELSKQGNNFIDTPPATPSNDWRLASRSGKLVDKESVLDYTEAIGWKV
jgi:hypothetical protein